MLKTAKIINIIKEKLDALGVMRTIHWILLMDMCVIKSFNLI